MSEYSPIEWTQATWNPITGCTPRSIGCDNCYAMRMAKRLKAMGNPNYANGFDITLHPQILQKPLTWKKPRFIFVNSMSDLFHESIPFEFIKKIFDTMRDAHWHTFQVLTKRSGNLLKLSKYLIWPDNVWAGVTVESEQYLYRVENLRKVNAKIRFLSFEPLLSPLKNINLTNIHWVIVGGESGPYSRIMKADWVVDILKQCQQQNIPFFFKQWGGINKKKSGRLLNGRIYSEIPSIQRLSF